MQKQIVYIPLKIEEGVDTLSSTNGKGEKVIYVFEDIVTKEAYSHWLKKQEAFVFTEEQLNELISSVIRETLNVAAENAEPDYWKGSCELCGSNTVDKQSILNQFDNVFNKVKV